MIGRRRPDVICSAQAATVCHPATTSIPTTEISLVSCRPAMRPPGWHWAVMATLILGTLGPPAGLFPGTRLVGVAAQSLPYGCNGNSISPLDLSASPPPAIVTSAYDPVSENLTFAATSAVYWDGSTMLYRTFSLRLGAGQLPECSAPSTNVVFSGSGASCTASLTLTAPWDTLRACDFTQAPEVDGLTTVSSTLYVFYSDIIQSSYGQNTRSGSYSQAVSLTFPTTVTAQTNFNVTDQTGRETFTVTQMTFTAASAQSRTLTMDYTVSIAYPFIYTWVNATAPAGLTLTPPSGPTPVFDPVGCGTGAFSEGQTCTQTATMVFTIPPATCNLQGSFKVGFTTTCVASSCPAGSYIFE